MSARVVGGSCAVEGIVKPFQLNSLGDSSKGHLGSTCFDLLAMSKVRLPDLSSEHLQDQTLYWDINILKVQTDTWGKKVLPVLPEMLPHCNS